MLLEFSVFLHLFANIITRMTSTNPSGPPIARHGTSTAPSGRIVVLNGFPGVGKLTILNEVKQLLPEETTCLLDNHLLIDPVVAVIPDRSDEHHELRRLVRAPIFSKLRSRVQEGHTILMTACLADDNQKDAAFLQEYLDLIRGTDVPMFWVNAYCEQAIQEERTRCPRRCQGAKTKLTDVRILRELLRDNRLIRPNESGDENIKMAVETLDVSGPLELSVARLMKTIGLS